MAYKMYRVSLMLYLSLLVANVAIIVLLIIYSPGFYSLLAAFLFLSYVIYNIWKLIFFPINQVKQFLLSMRCGERTIRIPNIKDAVLQEMYDSMNEIISRNYENEKSLEQKKIYSDRILRIMTHEIRNTVTPIISLSGHYLSHKDEAFSYDEILEGMNIINNQSKSIKAFLDSYHTLSHLSAPRMSKIYVSQLLSEQRTLADKQSNVKLKIFSPSQLYIYADAVQMHVVLSNLLTNAIHSAGQYPDGVVEISATMCEGSPFISVTDNGAGIPAERLDDIFLPFYTTKKDGSGIGLALSRRIMKLHGGELTVSSNPQSRRTVFTMEFARLV